MVGGRRWDGGRGGSRSACSVGLGEGLGLAGAEAQPAAAEQDRGEQAGGDDDGGFGGAVNDGEGDEFGGGGLLELLTQTIEVTVEHKHVSERELIHVNVDKTVQEKNITHPTDSKLLYKAIVKLGAAAKDRGVPLRQSYVPMGKRASVKAGRYAHARQFKRMRRELRKLRTWVGRMIRDIERKTGAPGSRDQALTTLLVRCQRLVDQKPSDSNKLYSLHEPEVRCISKGKAHKRYEFGREMALATTNRGDWFVGALLCEGNPYDGHTLDATLRQVESNTGGRSATSPWARDTAATTTGAKRRCISPAAGRSG